MKYRRKRERKKKKERGNQQIKIARLERSIIWLNFNDNDQMDEDDENNRLGIKKGKKHSTNFRRINIIVRELLSHKLEKFKWNGQISRNTQMTEIDSRIK